MMTPSQWAYRLSSAVIVSRAGTNEVWRSLPKFVESGDNDKGEEGRAQLEGSGLEWNNNKNNKNMSISALHSTYVLND